LKVLIDWSSRQLGKLKHSHKEFATCLGFRAYVALSWYLMTRSDEMFGLQRQHLLQNHANHRVSGGHGQCWAIILQFRKTNQNDSSNCQSLINHASIVPMLV
jgi:hypothetical protein